MDCLWVDRAQFEALLGLGFSKTEITSGQYHSDRLMQATNAYNPHDAAVEPHRGSRLLALAGQSRSCKTNSLPPRVWGLFTTPSVHPNSSPQLLHRYPCGQVHDSHRRR